MSAKAGQVVSGFSKVEGALQHGQAAALIHASDGAADGIRKLDAIAGHRSINLGESGISRSLLFNVRTIGFGTMATTERTAMATARPRPQVMRLTDAAALRIKDVMARADRPVAGVRVGVKNGGCAGMEYTMEYAVDIKATDEVVEDKGVKIFVDPKAVLFLLGTEMDYRTEKLSAQFIFNNPNQTSACGCGELVQLTPAKSAE